MDTWSAGRMNISNLASKVLSIFARFSLGVARKRDQRMKRETEKKL